MTAPTAPPAPPYYLVNFVSLRSGEDEEGYAAMAHAMHARALEQPGCLGVDSARGADGLGISVSYWADEASVLAWRDDAEHTLARELGRERWYASYALHIAKVERAYAGGDVSNASGKSAREK